MSWVDMVSPVKDLTPVGLVPETFDRSWILGQVEMRHIKLKRDLRQIRKRQSMKTEGKIVFQPSVAYINFGRGFFKGRKIRHLFLYL